MKHQDATIILLSFNALTVTDECLRRIRIAVKECHKQLNNKITVIVVDNGSKDGSAAMIRKKYPEFTLLALKENIGYAAGNNLAMKTIKTPYFILMNSDTYIEKVTLVKAFMYMEKNKSKTDAFFGKWVTETGVFHTYGGYLPTPLKIMSWAIGLESVPVLKYALPRIYTRNPSFYTRGGNLEWGPPCFMFAKKEIYDKTKGFDEKLWFHMVDVEWCKRINQAGFTIRFTPDIPMIHLEGGSSKGLEFNLLRDNFKGLLYYVNKHFPRHVRSVLFVVKLELYMRGITYTLLGKRQLGKVYSSIPQSLFV